LDRGDIDKPLGITDCIFLKDILGIINWEECAKKKIHKNGGREISMLLW
jgi:hypothetical protein